MGTIINDTPKCYRVVGYVVATDSFMSGWGGADGGARYYAVAVTRADDPDEIMGRMDSRSDFQRVRYNLRLPRLSACDHLHVVPAKEFTYQP